VLENIIGCKLRTLGSPRVGISELESCELIEIRLHFEAIQSFFRERR